MGLWHGPEGLEGYDTAQVCLNGHVINEYATSRAEHNQKFCSRCGEKTVTQCSTCSHAIRGYYHIPGDVGGLDFVAPSFCPECGKPYPWTERAIAAAKELISEADDLKDEEKESLKKSVQDLTADTPATQVAAMRFKRLLPKVGKEVGEALRKIVVDIASEAAKKTLFP